MTAYQNWFSDFPDRTNQVLEVLRTARGKALWREKNVTILLMVACSGFVVSLERLDESRASETGPNDAQEATRIRGLMEWDSPSFSKSKYVRNVANWKMGHLDSISSEPHEWPVVKNQGALAESFSVKYVLKDVLRNALAHGTVWATPAHPHATISELLFVSRSKKYDPSAGYDYVSVTVEEFDHFLTTWLSRISEAGGNVIKLVAAA